MRLALRLTPHLGTDDPPPDAEQLAEIAVAAEAAGFDAIYVTDHPAPPARLDPRGGHHDLDPFVTLSWVAARTTRLRLLTYLCVLPYRNPFLTAKTTSTLDQLSGGRLILGVGAGYLREEFLALGVPFDERNDLTDEALDVLDDAWSGRSVQRVGRHFEAGGNLVRPLPHQRPGPPVWVGGNSQRAARRAVERGDGWMPLPSLHARAGHLRTAGLETPDDLSHALTYLRDHAEKVGRQTPMDIVFTPLFRETYDRVPEPDRLVDSAAELHDLGVTYAVTQFVGLEPSAIVEHVAEYGERVVPALAALG